MTQYYRIVDEWVTETRVRLYLNTYDVLRETRCGVVIGHKRPYSTFEKLVLHNWRKKFAYPTIEEAIESFSRRKLRQIDLASASIKKAKLALGTLSECREQHPKTAAEFEEAARRQHGLCMPKLFGSSYQF